MQELTELAESYKALQRVGGSRGVRDRGRIGGIIGKVGMIVRSSPAGSADGAKTFGEGTCALGGGHPTYDTNHSLGGKGPLEVVGKLTYFSSISWILCMCSS